MHLGDQELTGTGRTRYTENTNIAVFSFINFELSSIKQRTLNEKRATQKNT